MGALFSTTYLAPEPEDSGPCSFRVGRHAQYYDRPFKDRARLTLRISQDEETGELYIRWNAEGLPAGGPDQGDIHGLEISENGDFPYALTSLPPSRSSRSL